ncbi:glycosyltransferase family 4 protein [Nitrosomonas sp. HPC101]|uniref:glycosyltransferase family 4 protein n=1 Tax=Nitrosomonas sp. HPC101 TaxID=1658667 RepID=UPI0013720B69|nr:glycosyltransferase family 4 protein [Nitrosomonas sp. HPC101]
MTKNILMNYFNDSMKTPQVKHAAMAYAKGDYLAALEIYKQLGKILGMEYFSVNIRLCEKRLEHFLYLNERLSIRPAPGWKGHVDAMVEVDALIKLAHRLLDSVDNVSFGPSVEGVLALVCNHIPSTSQSDYSRRIQQLVERIQVQGWDVVCIPMPEQRDGCGATGLESEMEITTEGHRYVQSIWQSGCIPIDLGAYLSASVEIYAKYFKQYRPKIVMAVGDFTSALPAIIAAKKLSLPVIKEQLHYSDVFQDREIQNYFLQFDFVHKYKIEQTCLRLADHSYYLYPEDPDSWEALFRVISQASCQVSQIKPVAVLQPKTGYTIKQTIYSAGLHYLEFQILSSSAGSPKGIVCSFRFFDAQGILLKRKLLGFATSARYPLYLYVDTTLAKSPFRVAIFDVPDDVASIEVDVIAFTTPDVLVLGAARLAKLRVEDVARWLSLCVAGVEWIKVAEAYVRREGAISLRLALLDYKYTLSHHQQDLVQLNSAIQEMVELDRTWLPKLIYRDPTIQVPRTNKLTIAHLHKTAYPYENTGGAIRCLNTVLSQKRIGIDPYIVTPIGYPRSAGILNAKNYEIIEGVEHFRIGADTDGLRSISFPDRISYSVFHIAKILKRRGASVIHAASGVRGYELALQALALKRITGLPVLYEVRSFHEHTWTPVRSDVMQLEKTQLRVIKEDFCMDEVDFITTISYSMKKILIERGIPSKKIEVIPNAIDESKYLGKKFDSVKIPELKGADFIVGYISNMSRREGHEYLIRAIHILRKRTKLDIRGLLVGNGPEHVNLQKLTNELGLEGIICFPGEIDHYQINGYYKAIDLFVIPRIPDYAADWVTPLKPYEAMALERPIIVTDLPALREVVGENEERGLIARPADVDSLIEKLQLYINNPVICQSKVKAARDWVFSERTWSANAKRYDAIYRRMIVNHDISKKEARYA